MPSTQRAAVEFYLCIINFLLSAVGHLMLATWHNKIQQNASIASQCSLKFTIFKILATCTSLQEARDRFCASKQGPILLATICYISKYISGKNNNYEGVLRSHKFSK